MDDFLQANEVWVELRDPFLNQAKSFVPRTLSIPDVEREHAQRTHGWQS
jgi:hypothetical protein